MSAAPPAADPAVGETWTTEGRATTERGAAAPPPGVGVDPAAPTESAATPSGKSPGHSHAATAVDTATAAGTAGAKPLTSPPTRGPVANTQTSEPSCTRRSMPTTRTTAPPPTCASCGCHANICGGWINSNCAGVVGAVGWTPAAAESHPAAKTGRRPSRKGSDGEAAHSIQPTPDAMRRPRGAAATTPNWHPTTAPDREASEPAVAGDGIGAANVASIPFEEPKTPPAPGIAAGGIACSSTAGWTYSNVHVGSSASVNTKSWSYPRCVALPSSARGGGDDARGGGALPFAATDVALEVLLPLSRGVRVIRVGEGVGEKSRRLPETVTSTAPSRSPAGSTQRTSTDAGADSA